VAWRDSSGWSHLTHHRASSIEKHRDWPMITLSIISCAHLSSSRNITVLDRSSLILYLIDRYTSETLYHILRRFDQLPRSEQTLHFIVDLVTIHTFLHGPHLDRDDRALFPFAVQHILLVYCAVKLSFDRRCDLLGFCDDRSRSHGSPEWLTQCGYLRMLVDVPLKERDISNKAERDPASASSIHSRVVPRIQVPPKAILRNLINISRNPQISITRHVQHIERHQHRRRLGEDTV